MSNIPVILIVGSKFCGKTTAANYIKTKIPKSVELTFAGPLKKACESIFLLSEKQLHDQEYKKAIDSRWDVTPREIFQKVGDLFRDYLHEVLPKLNLPQGLIFTSNMHHRIKELQESDNPPKLIIISDGRLPDEHNYVKSLKNSYSIRLIRDTMESDSHKSEQINFTTDSIIINNGTLEELYKQIDIIIDKFLFQ